MKTVYINITDVGDLRTFCSAKQIKGCENFDQNTYSMAQNLADNSMVHFWDEKRYSRDQFNTATSRFNIIFNSNIKDNLYGAIIINNKMDSHLVLSELKCPDSSVQSRTVIESELKVWNSQWEKIFGGSTSYGQMQKVLGDEVALVQSPPPPPKPRIPALRYDAPVGLYQYWNQFRPEGEKWLIIGGSSGNQ